MDEHEDRLIEGNFELVKNLDDNRQFKVSGFIYKDEPLDVINARIGKFAATLERQAQFSKIAVDTAKLKDMEFGAQQAADKHAGLIEKQKAGEKLSTTEKATLTTYVNNVNANLKFLDRFRANLEEQRKALNGSASMQ